MSADALETLNAWLISGVPDVGTCYVARLDGECSKYGFNREFISFKTDRGYWTVDSDAVSKGDVIEMCFGGQKSYVVVEATKTVGVGSKSTKQVFDVEIEKADALGEVRGVSA